nr:MAG: capsid protein [Inari totivirus 1]
MSEPPKKKGKTEPTAQEPKPAETTPAPVESTPKESAPTAGAEPPPKDDKPATEEKTSEPDHYGTHSIIPSGVLRIDPVQCGVDVGQDMIRKVAGAASTLHRRVVWRNDESMVHVADVLTWHKQPGNPLFWNALSSIPWAIGAADHSEDTQIFWVPPKVKSEYKMSEYAPFVGHNNILSLSQFGNSIRINSRMSKPVLEKMGPKLKDNPYVTDISGFFAMGFFLASHLQYMEKLGVGKIYPQVPENTLITCNIAEHENPQPACNAIGKAINCMALNFRRRFLTDQDVQVLQVMALGGASAISHRPGAVLIPITYLVTWPKLSFLVWDDNAVEVPAAIEELTADQVRLSMKTFANLLDAYDDMAVGFTKCASILYCTVLEWDTPPTGDLDPLNGLPDSLLLFLENIAEAYDESYKAIVKSILDNVKRVRVQEALDMDEPEVVTPTLNEVLRAAMIRRGMIAKQDGVYVYTQLGIDDEDILGNPKPPSESTEEGAKTKEKEVVKKKARRRALMHAMMDVSRIEVPQPKGANPLWDMMGVARPKDTTNQLLVDDGRELCGMDSELQMKTCLLIGAMLSVSASVVLNSINITGRELNLWAADSECRSTDLLRQIFQSAHGSSIAPYYQLIVGTFQQLMVCTIHPAFISGMDVFSGNGIALNEGRLENTWWEAVYPSSIPYVLEPAALTWIMKGWCDYWGYIGPDLTLDFSHDLVVGGPDGDEFFSFHRDEPLYLKLAESEDGYFNIAYGALALNSMIMLAQPIRRWVVTIRLAKMAAEGTAELGRPRYDIFQPRFNPVTGLLIVGTLLTYSWRWNCIIVPGLNKNKIRSREFYFLMTYPPGPVKIPIGCIVTARSTVPRNRLVD